jgi:hypothetical protein
MPHLNCQFLNGRNRLDSQIQLTARWLEGWKLKDGKWKYEEDEHLPHIGEGYFRCRVHLYSSWSPGISRKTIEQSLRPVRRDISLDGVTVLMRDEELIVRVPLILPWEKTDNESENPKIFRYSEGLDLHVEPKQQATLQILITYRNLPKLFAAERTFAEVNNGFKWIGSPRSPR